MSDLISRSELIKFFKEHMRTAKDFREIIINIIPTIKNQPTAYDIDKVVVELNKLDVTAIRRYEGGTFGNYEGTDYYIEKSKAIEIVKQGGISDDVCEWTLDGVYLHSPHKPLVSCVTDENYRYYYCPVCGKKIKVVEQMGEEDFCYCHSDGTDEYHDCLDYMECEECPYYYADED